MRACATQVDTACIGQPQWGLGDREHDSQCREGQMGGLCTVCEPGWHGGSVAAGEPCKECPTDETELMLAFIVPCCIGFGVVVGIVLTLRMAKKVSKGMILGLLPEEVPARADRTHRAMRSPVAPCLPRTAGVAGRSVPSAHR